MMDAADLRRLLSEVADGALTSDEAASRIIAQSSGSSADLSAGVAEVGDFAAVDLHRRARCGFPEVIFGQGKTPDQVASIMKTLVSHGNGGLATRIAPEVGERLSREFPEGEYNALGRTFQVLEPDADSRPKHGRVAVVTAGTSDLPVAEEARATVAAWGCEVQLIADVGVAGIHRLFRRLEELRRMDVLVVVAGMEGALPSVVGGLVDCPVIAVPTSIGYGAHFHGLASLLGMLNSCSSNVVVVNIDSGFNAGHVAGLIARRMAQARGEMDAV